MTYLKKGETYRSRLEELLEKVRSLPTNATSERERARDEAGLLISLIHADAAEALVSATLEPTGELDVVSVDDAVKSFDYAFSTEVPFRQSRGLFIRDLCGADREEPAVGDADREGPPYSFTPDALARVRDSLAFDVKDGEPTPRLPGEQTVATDPEPEVDFEMEIDVTAETLDEVGKSSDLDGLDPTDDLDEDDPDLDDFRPAPRGKPASTPETPLQKAKKAHSKKETKK